MKDTIAGQPPATSDRAIGAVLVIASAAFFALAGIFTKSIASDPWTIAGWRGLVGGLAITVYVIWRRRNDAQARSLRLGWRGMLLAAVGGLASLAFIAAFKLTYVANVAIIYATVPLMAAGLEWLFLRHRPSVRTVATALVSLCGVGIIVGGGLGSGTLRGDLFAVAMTIGCALYMVMIRIFRNTPVVWAGAVSAYMLFAVSWLITDPLSISATDARYVILFGLTFACASILWTEAMRLISAGEAGVLGSAEVPFAILFAWIFLAELPPAASLIGGAVVLGAVLYHAFPNKRMAAASKT